MSHAHLTFRAHLSFRMPTYDLPYLPLLPLLPLLPPTSPPPHPAHPTPALPCAPTRTHAPTQVFYACMCSVLTLNLSRSAGKALLGQGSFGWFDKEVAFEVCVGWGGGERGWGAVYISPN